jgi:hypothetical protein
MAEDPRWLTASEAAAYLRISRRQFDRLGLPRHQLSIRTPRFQKVDLDVVMESRRVEQVTLVPLRAAPIPYTAKNFSRSNSASHWRKQKLAELHRSRTATASSKSDGAK